MPEKEYIEREALVDIFEDKMQDDNTMCPVIKVLDVLEVIENTPTADVAEVKHGVWNLYFDGKELMCSVCKATFWDECGNGGTNYCPNCGAKMDGGKNV